MSFFSEPDNDTRANLAEMALDVFCSKTFGGRDFQTLVGEGDHSNYSDAACALGDLICDLMHLARRQGFDPHSCVNAAIRNFEAEEEEAVEEDRADEQPF
jgi:hypothetical protein